MMKLAPDNTWRYLPHRAQSGLFWHMWSTWSVNLFMLTDEVWMCFSRILRCFHSTCDCWVYTDKYGTCYRHGLIDLISFAVILKSYRTYLNRNGSNSTWPVGAFSDSNIDGMVHMHGESCSPGKAGHQIWVRAAVSECLAGHQPV